LRFGSSCFEIKSYRFDNSEIEAKGIICESGEIERCVYRRFEDDLLIVVKCLFFQNFLEYGLIEKELEKFINLCHPCLAVPIGFVFGSGLREIKVLGISSESESLFKIIVTNPVWWTPTAKAKAVAGLVLGLRFAHSFGFIHGHLTTNNIVFDLSHRIQITDFWSCLSGNGLSDFSNEKWNPEIDIRVFVLILFEIVVGHPANDETDIPADVPMFVCEMIKTGLSGEWRKLSSFLDIFETLKQHNFEIVSGVDSEEVLAFISWVEELEQFRE
jgi:hypothetical protein